MADGTYYGPGYRSAGINNVGSYQASGTPYITGNFFLSGGVQDKIVFPAVTSRVIITANTNATPQGAAPIRIHFASTGTDGGNVVGGNHYVTLSQSVSVPEPSFDARIKCKELFVSCPVQAGAAGLMSGSYTIFAELTGIGIAEMFTLTGSGVTS